MSSKTRARPAAAALLTCAYCERVAPDVAVEPGQPAAQPRCADVFACFDRMIERFADAPTTLLG